MTSHPDELIPCPHSESLQQPLADNFKLHYASRAELGANGGVCAKCRRTFLKHNRHVLAGRHETPVDFHQHHAATLESDHVGYDAHGMSQVVGFDYDAADGSTRDEDEPDSDERGSLADALAAILTWIWLDGASNPQAAVVKFAAMSAAIRPQLLSDESYEEIGKRFGVSKAAVSKAALVFSERFGFKAARSRTPESRRNMANSMRSSHARRHATTDAPSPPKGIFFTPGRLR